LLLLLVAGKDAGEGVSGGLILLVALLLLLLLLLLALLLSVPLKPRCWSAGLHHRHH
jgi:hypothetical protein